MEIGPEVLARIDAGGSGVILHCGSTGREKGKIGFGLSIGSILWNLGFAAYVSWKMGLFDR